MCQPQPAAEPPVAQGLPQGSSQSRRCWALQHPPAEYTGVELGSGEATYTGRGCFETGTVCGFGSTAAHRVAALGSCIFSFLCALFRPNVCPRTLALITTYTGPADVAAAAGAGAAAGTRCRTARPGAAQAWTRYEWACSMYQYILTVSFCKQGDVSPGCCNVCSKLLH